MYNLAKFIVRVSCGGLINNPDIDMIEYSINNIVYLYVKPVNDYNKDIDDKYVYLYRNNTNYYYDKEIDDDYPPIKKALDNSSKIIILENESETYFTFNDCLISIDWDDTRIAVHKAEKIHNESMNSVFSLIIKHKPIQKAAKLTKTTYRINYSMSLLTRHHCTLEKTNSIKINKPPYKYHDFVNYTWTDVIQQYCTFMML